MPIASVNEPGGNGWRGRHVASGEPVLVRSEDGNIALVDRTGDGPEVLPWIGPGLVDIQVNGFAGIDLNDDNLTVKRVHALARALLRVGVTTFLPTIITADAEAISDRLRIVAAAASCDPLVETMIGGIHLEGPFISPEDGPRGAHPKGEVRAPEWELFQRWQEAAGGRIKIVTLSPEWPAAMSLIERCRKSGVIPAIGHTAATPQQIREAIQAGAMLSTHLGNGAHAMLPRHPNYLWEQLAADELWASFIADGFHLPDAVIKTIMRMKGERAVTVSDSVALAGMPPGQYETAIGSRVTLTPEGRLCLTDDPRLMAGSAQPLLAGVSHLVRSGLATLGEAWEMASTAPLCLLGRAGSEGMIAGAPADLVLFALEHGGSITIQQVVKAGRLAVDANRAGGRRSDR